MNDDITGSYLDNKQKGYLTPAQIALGKGNQSPEVKQQAYLDLPKKALDAVGSVVADVGKGIVETPRQVVGGAYDATKEMAEGLEGIIQSVTGELPVVQLINPKTGEWDLDLVDKQAFTEQGGQMVADLAQPEEARSVTGNLVRNVSQFLTAFIPASKVVGAVGKGGKIAQAATAGAIADIAAFDGKEGRLSDLIESVPSLKNPVTEFLASDPNDSELEGRLKNVIEGLGLGVMADGLMYAFKGMKANRVAKLKASKEAAEQAKIDKLSKTDVKEGELMPLDDELAENMPSFKVGSKKADPDQAKNINLARLETTNDVQNLIDGMAEAEYKKYNKARREVVTHEQTLALADELGMTVDDLLKRRSGEAFNAEQALAARKLLVASGENLIELAKKAKTGSEKDVVMFRRALSQHSAIQSQVSGMTAEAGRALQSFRIMAQSAKEQERMITDALEASGGSEWNRALAGDMVAALENGAQLSTFVKLANKATSKDMMYEAWINGLLSSPATHAVNVISNSLVAGWSVLDRQVSSVIGMALDEQNIPRGEAAAQLWGMVHGAKDGFKMAWHALKTGEPSDVLQKIEHAERKAITAENLNLSGNAGRFADFVGEGVRMPGRFLTAGDEFFKSVGYRMELNAQAFRMAAGEGLEGEELALRMKQIMDNPPDNIHLMAVDAQRYQTFTNELGPAGKSFQSFVNKFPAARVIVPFIRTPTNIIKYVGEHSPIAPAINKGIREDILAGGARRDLALGKIATGSMAMAIAADYTLSGDITGGGPKNPQLRSAKMATGWQPYSIKVGDKYYSYSRLDPIGAFIGLAADASEMMGQTSEADALDLAVAASTAVAQNITSKTYLSGVAEFFNAMSSIQADPEAENKSIQRWLQRLGGSVVPAGVAQLERMNDPTLRAANGILEQIQSRTPGFSESLPPRRNIFGEPIELSGGLGPDIMSPVYISENKHDPIADEIVAQRVPVRMPLKSIKGVDLDTEQYDEYIRLYSGENNPYVDMPLKDKLREEMASDMYMFGTDGPDGSKSLIIQTVFSGYRQAAQQAMIDNNPELEIQIRANATEKANKLGAY